MKQNLWIVFLITAFCVAISLMSGCGISAPKKNAASQNQTDLTCKMSKLLGTWASPNSASELDAVAFFEDCSFEWRQYGQQTDNTVKTCIWQGTVLPNHDLTGILYLNVIKSSDVGRCGGTGEETVAFKRTGNSLTIGGDGPGGIKLELHYGD